ncbi:hypothetical protein RFN29_13400 [Mesorhizobium sp. VK22B]|uniref:Uncharacterized protein n=1 Tax=Mesorhizobium captivum TaxID=3072319 RepID=A0ABU4Z045_9HYPH|nr:hypothetical protein [Mesorhizobium sp. VK22B]MDX8492572.1 hypothetical protein [Mesorhizobium sp. VK22B]
MHGYTPEQWAAMSSEERNRISHRASMKKWRSTESAAKPLAAPAAKDPKNLPRWMRDDIIMDMVIAILEGQTRLEELAAQAAAFVRKHNREYETFALRSIDARDDTGRALVDKLTEQHLPW